MRPLDTSPAAHAAQVLLYRKMTAEQRSVLALRMSDEVRTIAEAGIRQRHPEYCAREVRQVMIAMLYGRDLAQRRLPNDRVPAA